MSEQIIVFGESNGNYPGQVCRVGTPIDWEAIRDASEKRQRRDKDNSNASVRISGENSSHASIVSSASTSQRPSSSPTHNSGEETMSVGVDQEIGERTRSSSSSFTPLVTALEKLKILHAEPAMNLEAVKKLAWAGLPSSMRAPIWKVLLGYVPTNLSRRKDTLERKRREYREAVEQHYNGNEDEVEESPMLQASNSYTRVGNQEDVTMRQIAVDIPRTCPGQALFHIPEVQVALQRILYVWATRHPASGYVQGMNDLVTPFVFVFLTEHIKGGCEMDILDMTDMSSFEDAEEAIANAEADAYWCLTALLNDIQDYYTFSQPGIQRRVHFLRELVARVDSNLCIHLEEKGLDFLQFAFRWMNCLLMRELPFPLIVRVWDTYLAETDGFAIFHVYVCAALLVSFSEQLLEMEFQDLVMFLQNLPTESWGTREIDVVLSQAYMWRTIFGAAPSHLQ